MSTGIEWTDETWNPVTGCVKVSQGCKHCYAETIAERFWKGQYPPNADGSPRRFTDVRCHRDRLDQPLRWRRPRRVFVNSMSDLFHEDVPDQFVSEVFNVMARATDHSFQVLTKRPRRMLGFTRSYDPEDLAPNPLPNVWLGVSCENQKAVDERLPLLLQTPAVVRFLSCEPLLGPLAGFDVALADWVIVGGESGPGARPMDLDWVINIVQACSQYDVPVFVKQLGGHPDARKDPAAWPEYLRRRQYPGLEEP